MRFTKKLPSVKNVGAGLQAVIECPLGRTYDRISLFYTGTAVTRAMFTNLQVMINGKAVQTYADFNELQYINDYYGRADTAGVVTLYFVRPELENTNQSRLTALGTVDIQTLDVRFDIAAGAPSDLAITAWAMTSEPQPLGLITKVKAFPMSSSVSGEIEIDNLVTGPRIAALHLFKSDVNNLEIDYNGIKIFEASKTVAEVIQTEHGRVPVTASATHVDFLLEGDNTQALITQGATDFRLRPTLGTSGALRTVVEYLDGLAGI